MINNPIVSNENNDSSDSDDKPDLPQVKNVSREFIKYRAKMIETPVNYDVLQDFDETKKTFNGICKINFNLVNLNVNDYIHVDFCGKVNWMLLNGTEVPDDDICDYMLAFNQGVFFRVPRAFLKEGENNFVIGFTAWYNNEAFALYKHNFDHMDKGGIYPGENMIYSQLEPHYTHRVFPCFAQLDIRCKTSFVIIRNKDYTAVSNESIQKSYSSDNENSLAECNETLVETFKLEKFDEGKAHLQLFLTHRQNINIDIFNRTINIPYQVLFISAGKFTYYDSNYVSMVDGKERNLPLRIWCHAPRHELLAFRKDYFFDIVKGGLKFYENYFGVPYPYSKYDMIFLPSFSFNAMENPGCVAIQDKNFAPYMESQEKIMNRDRMFLHEMAHMWNGNLVSMEWFNDLWIKEGLTE